MANKSNIEIQIQIIAKQAERQLKSIEKQLKGIQDTSKDNTKEVVKQFDKITKAAKKTNDQMKKGFKASELAWGSFVGNLAANAVTSAFNVMGRAAGAFASELKSSITYAQQQQNALNSLAAQMKVNGDFTESGFRSLQKFASELQRTTTVGDETTLQMLALAKAYGATDDMAKKAVKAAIEYAKATGKDVNEAIRQVTKTFGGYAGELGEVIPELKDLTKEQLQAGKAADLLNEKFGGSASEELNTFSGTLDQVKNTYGDLLEVVGNIIIQNPAVTEGMRELQRMFLSLTEEIVKHQTEWKKLIGDVFTAFVSSMKVVVEGIKFFVANGTQMIEITKTLGNQLIKFTLILGSIKLAFFAATTGTAQLAAALIAARAAVTGFFASLGPVGWAIIGISAAVTAALAIFDSYTDEQKDLRDATIQATDAIERQKEAIGKLQEKYATMSLEQQKKELEDLKKRYNQLAEQIDKMADKGLAAIARGTFGADIYKEIQALDMLIKDKEKQIAAANDRAKKKAQQEAEDKRKEQEKEAEKELEARLNFFAEVLAAEEDFRQIQADNDRIKNDEKLATIAEQFGKEEALKFLSDQRKLEQEGKHWEAMMQLRKKYAEAQSKEKQGQIDSDEAGSFGSILAKNFGDEFTKAITEFGAAPIAETLSAFGKSLWEWLPAWSKVAINAGIEIAGYIIDGVGLVLQGMDYLLSGAFINDMASAVETIASMPSNLLVSLESFDRMILDFLNGTEDVDSLATSINQLVDRAPEIFGSIIENLPKLVEKIVEAIPKMIELLANELPALFESLLDGLDKIVAELFSEENINKMADMLDKMADSFFDKAPGIIENIMKALPTIIERLLQGMTKIAERLPELLAPIFENLGAIVGSIIDNLPNLITAILDSLPTIVKQIADALPDVIENLAENIDVIVLALVDGLIANAGDIIAALIDSLLIEGGLERIVGALLRAIPRIAVALVQGFARGLYKAVDAIGAAFGRGLRAAWDNIKGTIGGLFSKWGKALFNSFASTGNMSAIFQKWGEKIWDGFGKLWEAAKELFTKAGEYIWEGFQALWNAAKDVFAKAGAWIYEKFSALWDEAKDVFSDAGAAIWNGFLALWDEGKDIFSAAGTAIYDTFAALWEGTKDIFSKAGEAIYNAFGGLWDSAKGIFGEAGEAIFTFFKELWDGATSIFDDGGKGIWNAFKNLWDKSLDIFGNAGKGIWNGLKKAWDSTASFVSDLGATIWSGLKDALGNVGTTFSNLGGKIWDGLKDGLKGFGDIIKDAFDALNPKNLMEKLFAIDFKGKGTVEKKLGIDVPFAKFAKGGLVPGKAKVSGDSATNDEILALLSPGEFVIPRSLMQNTQFASQLAKLIADPVGYQLQRYAWGGSVKVGGTTVGVGSGGVTVGDQTFDPADIDPTNPNNKLPKKPEDVNPLEKLWDIVKGRFWDDLKSGLGFAAGGQVPYAPGIDTVPAMLTGGEFVVNRNASLQHQELLRELNRGVRPFGYNDQNAMAAEKLDLLIEAVQRGGNVIVEIDGREVATVVRKQHERGFNRSQF